MSNSVESNETIYCAGCNERFAHVLVAGVCPRCGAAVSDTRQRLLQETLLLKDAPEVLTDEALPAEAKEAELDYLLGSRLHVYRCETLLGRGGMGRVYLAYHVDLERKCALKVLSPRVTSQNFDFVRRFLDEGKAAAGFSHPNIVTTHAIGTDRGFHFIEMEFVSGESLQQLIEREAPLTPVRATVLATQIAEGLSAAHQAGLVHRDLKPDNVLMSRRGIPKIGDFGLAKRVLAEEGDARTEGLVGTPNFMAPELFQGHPATAVSDVYALGVSYFLLLTGTLPFTAGSVSELMRAVIEEPTPSPREFVAEIPLEMAECLSLLLAKAPENRPPDGIAAAQMLRAVGGQIRDIESLLREAFSRVEGVSWMRAGNRYRLHLSLPDGRRQVLFVEPSDHSATERLLLIYSICCPAHPEYYEEALRLNAEIPHGGLSIREIDGKPQFVMGDTYPRATVDVEEIRRSVLEVGFRADAVEKLLTGEDEN